ncbi:hypothetical protein EDB81DRAFT_663505 [Dactylonectria macrodidyma]|uniref:AttH domain-containing protein n=1 Tax=Dactylonectria macrodidyma TaxID=307937 RepID=A0A9P9IMN0_9HYPO|nr:hypothetical protein EDB81DRAFT_663505 [Dactylonectria macrodidyma]
MTSFMLKVLITAWACTASATLYKFQPDKHSTWENKRVPSLMDLSKDQNSGSYFSTAFVTATTGEQFLLVHHQVATSCKSSVLELETLRYWKHVENCVVSDLTKNVSSDSVSIRFPNFSFASAAPDKISELELFAKSSNYKFTLDVEPRTSKVLLTSGNGVIAWGPGYANSTHWSIPAARTSGTLELAAGSRYDLDNSKSFTWYDHQIISGVPGNFTWFEVHFPNPNIRVSIWAYDWPESSDSWRYASVRIGEETIMVIPFTLEANWDTAWVSPVSNRTYPQSWVLKFENGDYLSLQSVREDQEIADGAWTGFVTVKRSRFLGQTSGFGVADTVYM